MKWIDLHLTMLVSVRHRSLPRSLALLMNCSTYGFNYNRNGLCISFAFIGGCMML